MCWYDAALRRIAATWMPPLCANADFRRRQVLVGGEVRDLRDEVRDLGERPEVALRQAALAELQLERRG